MREERHRSKLLLQTSRFGVFNYADNFDRFSCFRTINTEPFTYRRTGGEKLSHHRFIDERDFLRVLRVLRPEDSSLQHGNPHRGKEVFADDVIAKLATLSFGDAIFPRI